MNSRLLLAVSVALNVVAGGYWLALHRSHPATLPSPTPAVAEAPKVEAPVRVEPAPKPIVAPATSWVQALRDAQISEKVIAEVAAVTFEDHWHALALENQKKFDRGEIDQTALTGFDLDHDEAREKEMRAALGDEAFRRWDQARELRDLDRSGVQLSADESDQLYELRKDLDRKRLELDKARHDGKLTDEDAASQSQALYTQYNQQLLKLLGNDRYAQMQNGGDTGASDLARNLKDLNVTDSQVSGMQTAEQNWNSQKNGLDVKLQKGDISAEDYAQQMKTLEAQRDADYQKVLGPDGFAQFQRDQSEQYQMLKRLGPGMGFTSDDVNNLYAMIQDYQTQVQDYRDRAQQLQNQGQSVDWSAVDKVLANYSQQTENALREELGDKFDKLKRSNVMPFER
ncbi:MAG TPA: hypothetical protein VN873_20420 [Candidatus Angelobacter sp.]|nr:hypothetical protein [Candidatus Angelobacter sp.]